MHALPFKVILAKAVILHKALVIACKKGLQLVYFCPNGNTFKVDRVVRSFA